MLNRLPPSNGLPAGQHHGAVAPAGAYGGHHPAYGPTVYDEEDAAFNPLTLLVFVVRYRWLIAVLVAVGLAAGLVITWMQTPQYRAAAKLEIMVPSAKVFQDLEVVSESSDTQALFTAAEKLKSRALAQRVVYELGLADKPDFLFPNPDFAISNLFARAFGQISSHDLNDYTPEQRENIAINRVRHGLSVELIRNTSLLAVSYSNQVPEYAAAVANQLAASFIDQRVDQTSETSDLARQFIQEQVEQVKDKLQASEKALVDYAKEEGITVTGGEQSLIASNITAINTALGQAIQERLDYGRMVQQIQAGKAESLPRVIDSEGIQRMRETLAELSAEYQQKLATFKPEFPEMQTLSARIREMRRQIDDAIQAMADSVIVRYEEAKSKEEDLRAKLAELEGEQSAYQDKNIQYTILKREVDSNRAQYESLIAKLNEVGVGSELRNRNAAIIDAALVPSGPYSPRLLINLGAALALAFSLAAAIIYLLELLNNTFSNPDQIEADLKLPVLGILPMISEEEFAGQMSAQQSALSEAYRSLRTALQFTGTEGAPATLLVTSSEPAEGKSTTAFKLAQDFAALGANVLVIDADMRKPNLHRLFGINNVLGLSNLLTNTLRTDDAKEIFKKTSYPNVTLMTAGTIPPNPADLLSSPKMGVIINACSSRYDMIIFDGPPIVGLADAPILARLIETTLLVVSAGQVTRKSAATALKRIQSAGGVVAGAALSKFEVNKFEYNYAYKYMSYQYHTYGSQTPKLTGARHQEGGSHSLLHSMRARMRDITERTNRRLYRDQ